MSIFKIVHARSLQKAIEKGAKLLGVPEDRLRYRVLFRNKTFFGKEKVTIFVSIKDETVEKISSKKKLSIKKEGQKRFSAANFLSNEDEKDGKVWIKSGQVYCKNGIDHFPVLHPCEGVEVFLNGKVKEDLMVVTEDDHVELKTTKKKINAQYSLEASPDQMEVLLTIQPGYVISRQICDSSPSRSLQVKVTEEKKFLPVQEEEIYQALAACFRANAIPSRIRQACSSEETKPFVIAKGTPAVPGQDGRFVPVDKKPFELKGKKAKERGWQRGFTMVHEGDIIGHIEPPVDGQKGYDVFGNTIEPKKPKPLQVRTKEGALYLKSQGLIVANRSGRVSIDCYSPNKWMFQVVPFHVHNQNVNQQTGSIRFDGDVYIAGDVEEGMVVEASKSIYITGSVRGSAIQANGDITIQGDAHAAMITSGTHSVSWKEILTLGRETCNWIVNMISAVHQLTSNPSFSKSDLAKRGFQPLLKVLMEMKFVELPPLIQTLKRKTADYLSEDWTGIINLLDQTFLQHHPAVVSVEQLKEIASKLENYLDEMELEVNKETCVSIKSAHQSELISAGRIVIEDGVYQSTIHSKTTIQVRLVQGSQLVTGEQITVSEAGSPTDTGTVLIVQQKEGVIVAESLWPNTTIQVGETTVEKLSQPEKQATVRLQEDGLMIIERSTKP